MSIAGLTEYDVKITSRMCQNNLSYSIRAGWPAVAMGLKGGDRVQLEPVSREPWRLRLTLLPVDSVSQAER